MKLAMRPLPLVLATFLCAAGITAATSPAFAQKKDYLSDAESEKIRDAETTSERIKLFISFAADRIKKLQYRIRPSRRIAPRRPDQHAHQCLRWLH